MSTFFLIDHSLAGVGTHHFDYAACVVNAVRRSGRECIVGTHRTFREPEAFGPDVRIEPVFRNTTYSKVSFLAGLETMARQAGDESSIRRSQCRWGIGRALMRRWQTRRRFKQRRRLIRQFAVDCEDFFAPHMLDEADQVLVACASELDLMGLAAFLCNHPRTNQLGWSVLFHFPVFRGRPADYATQFQTAQRVRRCFESALSRIPYHRLALYTTTAELADQYNRLRIADFCTLTYPVQVDSLVGKENQAAADAKPLRLTLAGAIRREKGQTQIAQSLVDGLWGEGLANGRLRLIVQRPARSRWRRPKIELRLPDPNQAGAIDYLDHPLDHAEYLELIRTTGVGVLAYDAQAYFARRAGILGEYLIAGKPVIVPGACWLAEQIQPAIQAHVRHVLATHPPVQTLTMEGMTYAKDNLPQPGGVVVFDSERRPFEITLSLRQPANMLALEFRSHFPSQSGAFCRIDVAQSARGESMGPDQSAVLGTRDNTQRLAALFRQRPGADEARIRFSNACPSGSLSVCDIQAITFAADQAIACSAVGVIAADNTAMVEGVREIVAHYDHYRQTAQSFARGYRIRHQPEQMLAELVGRFVPQARSA
jgi:hypothetical protein